MVTRASIYHAITANTLVPLKDVMYGRDLEMVAFYSTAKVDVRGWILGTLSIASIKTYTFSISKFVGFWLKRLKTF